MGRFAKITAVLFLLAGSLFAFQNCSGVAPRARNDASMKSGNGDGYTGKVFVELGMCDGVANAVKARIAVKSSLNDAVMTVDSCESMGPDQVMPVQRSALETMPDDPDKLMYMGRVFVRELVTPALDSFGPACSMGNCVRFVGQGLCLNGGLSYAVFQPAAGSNLAPVRVDAHYCAFDGVSDVANVNLPASYLSEGEGSVNVTFVNPWGGEAEGVINLGNYALPQITSVTERRTAAECENVANECLIITGRFLGGQCVARAVTQAGTVADVQPYYCRSQRVLISGIPANSLRYRVRGHFGKESNTVDATGL